MERGVQADLRYGAAHALVPAAQVQQQDLLRAVALPRLHGGGL